MYPLSTIFFGVLATVVAWNPGLLRGIPVVRRIMPDVPSEPIPLLPEATNGNNNNIHLIVLVHGIFGSPLEMGNLQDFLVQQGADPASDDDHEFVVHSTGCNEGRTHDGLAAGGTRIADEINEWLVATRKTHGKSRISLSMVGNSLGGLYARYALSKINWKDPATNETILHPEIFCTTVTPHLGVAGQHTYAPVGRVLEYAIANALGVTGQDLFRFTPLLQSMAVDVAFVQPLAAFPRRMAYANAYYTDFQVPGSTAAFLGGSALHRVIASPAPASNEVSIILSVATDERVSSSEEENDNDDEVQLVRTGSSGDESSTTEESSTPVLTADQLAARLDDLGWTKHFVDLRRTLVTVPNPFASADGAAKKEKELSSIHEPGRQYYSSRELWRMYTRFSAVHGWHVPLGHTMLLANKKDAVNERMNAAGKPLMRQLAGILVDSIVHGGTNDS